MRFNVHGIIGLFAIVGMAVIALTRKGSFTPVVILLIVIYAIALIWASIATDSKEFASGADAATKVYAKSLAQVWIIALHITFMLALLTFFLGLPYQPFINLALVPLALLVSYSLTGLTLNSSTNGVQLNVTMGSAIAPTVVLIVVAEFEEMESAVVPIRGLDPLFHSTILEDDRSPPLGPMVQRQSRAAWRCYSLSAASRRY